MPLEDARPDFSGVWDWNSAKSVMRGPAPARMVVTIEHREPQLVQRVAMTGADGSERSQTFHIDTGGETTNSVGGATLRTQARWEGAELVIESWMPTPQREFHFKDHWSLSADGLTLTMAHRDDDLAGQVAVLERISPSKSAS